ncbi:TetR/AcrR family transcriptional regulator [Actinomadura kijaniata]|uniref:TetR/AcrR family transcriptional regulator n=1 Tax=Actinomadura kijaniata TaxID=46161 RepID=UPI000835D954|nr:TetR/AcrR family transcriptional regulator [Actinomadura kijaniata]
MSDTSQRRLPRGRHALPPDQVERIQRDRLCAAMAGVMAEKGYARTSVEDVLRRAGVSRQTFYRIFDSKLDCFMAAFDRAGELLLERLLATAEPDSPGAPGEPVERFAVVYTAYLDALAAEWPYTRLFLVEVFAAGPEAMARRTGVQDTIAAGLADILGVTGEAGRRTCQMIVAATSALVTARAVDNDPEGLRALGPPMIAHVRRLWEAGMFTEAGPAA